MAVSVKIDTQLQSRIKRLAKARERSAHWIMCKAIEDYVEREEKRESFRKEALASWQAFQETGLHLSESEIRDWLSTWGEEHEAQLPPCHD